ncbi:complement resistance protein TraT [Nitrospira moscoviensis]|uniref:Putative Lipoprotein, TraT related n=1 Tax=Nitrospira moscoviensis TaxID=42253 RepID=A0A0K2GJR9_NITMO|nr:complement resistance protein TraT [Nitrospira moscoviensis]ALA61200.1 putative Lipoprotein, TraT related [Nitrospira moscoviensis]
MNLFLLLLLLLVTGCSNVIRSGLMNSNTVFLDPNTNRTAYLQLRNASENQQVSLTGIEPKLTAKGYQLKSDPEQANYWIQAKVIYCHKAAEDVTPESVAKAGPGAGISSGGTPMAPADDPMAGMPDMSALMRQMSGMRGMGGMGFPGMQPPAREEGVTYLCVADVQITDRKLGKAIGQPAGTSVSSGAKVQQMRMVGHVRQKDLDIPEATPIIQEKISTGIAGLF